jgi:EAL domain-containing protein (putative c-di-GMP-specific phosphodiesterase class I)
MVSPADFIPIAEDTGLIIELGKQVLYQACCQCQLWNQRFNTRLSVSVNVSGSQFAQPGLLQEIKAILRATRLDPQLLKLEITESVLLSGYHAAEEVLSGARALGIDVCLDDFGTGYSSLSYLLRFPFDVVKIDRSFIRHLDSDHRRAEMVRMVLQLAATLNKQVVAEGIESQAELEHLRELGCGRVQGFLLSRPLTDGAVVRLLEAETPIALKPAEKARPWEVRAPAKSMILAKDERPGLSNASL